MSRFNREFKCLSCECVLDESIYGAYCNRCLNFDESDIPVLVSRETIIAEICEEKICKEKICAVCNRVEKINDLCLCSKCYKEHLHFAIDESEDVEDSDLEVGVGEQDLIDAQHALNDNEEYTEEENAEYFRLTPQPHLERKCCETFKDEIHR